MLSFQFTFTFIQFNFTRCAHNGLSLIRKTINLDVLILCYIRYLALICSAGRAYNARGNTQVIGQYISRFS